MGYMTDGLTFNVLRGANEARADQYKNSNGEKTYPNGIKDWTPGKWMCALTGEVGETANLIKKVFRGDLPQNEETKHMIANELADIQTYLDLLAASMDIDLGIATCKKFNEVSERVGSNVFMLNGTDWAYRK